MSDGSVTSAWLDRHAAGGRGLDAGPGLEALAAAPEQGLDAVLLAGAPAGPPAVGELARVLRPDGRVLVPLARDTTLGELLDLLDGRFDVAAVERVGDGAGVVLVLPVPEAPGETGLRHRLYAAERRAQLAEAALASRPEPRPESRSRVGGILARRAHG